MQCSYVPYSLVEGMSRIDFETHLNRPADRLVEIRRGSAPSIAVHGDVHGASGTRELNENCVSEMPDYTKIAMADRSRRQRIQVMTRTRWGEFSLECAASGNHSAFRDPNTRTFRSGQKVRDGSSFFAQFSDGSVDLLLSKLVMNLTWDD